MAIDWESGDITDEQHELRPTQRLDLVRDMVIGSEAYVDADDLGVSPDGKFWVHGEATAWPETEVPHQVHMLEFLRLIQTPDGLIADVSCGDYTIDDDPDNRFATDRHIKASDGWLKTIGLVETSEQRIALGEMLFNKYGIFLNASALEAFTSEENEDE